MGLGATGAVGSGEAREGVDLGEARVAAASAEAVDLGSWVVGLGAAKEGEGSARVGPAVDSGAVRGEAGGWGVERAVGWVEGWAEVGMEVREKEGCG